MKTVIRTALLFLGVSSLFLSVSAPPAFAVGWETNADSWPTHLPPGGTGIVYLTVLNVGEQDSTGTVTVTDVLPRGLTATVAGANDGGEVETSGQFWNCTIVPGTEENSVVTCTSARPPSGGGGVPDATGNNSAYEFAGAVTRRIAIAVEVSKKASGTLINRVAVAGGGASTTAGTSEPIVVSSTPATFGVSDFDAWFSNADGTIDTQAGSHPYLATFMIDSNTAGTVLAKTGGGGQTKLKVAGGEIRNYEVQLPPGLVGDPTAVPQCPREVFDRTEAPQCSAGTQVGIIGVGLGGGSAFIFPVYNLVPPPGKPAEFGFSLAGNDTFLDSGVRTGGDYGITTHADNTPQRQTDSATLTLWGVPSDPSHDRWRGNGGGLTSGAPPKPFLTLPTQCAGPQRFSVRVNNWYNEAYTEPVSFLSHDSNGNPVGFTGCEHLGFAPTITTKPDTANADTPAGLTVEVTPPVGGLSSPTGLGTADIQNTTVTLPEGLVINPGQAAGLQACQSYQSGVGTEAAPSCPAASKVGVVTIKSPLIEGDVDKQFEGNVYVLQSNPPELKLLVAASADGVNVKFVGVVHMNERTGQLTTMFQGTPELPFTVFKLSFSGGAQAGLATPTQCGSYGPGQGFFADFTSWASAPGSSQNFLADAFPTASFGIEAGPGSGPCPSSPLPFTPGLIAGSTTDQAGGFTNFSLLLQSGDAQQRIEKLQFRAPQGLSAMLSQVSLCPEPQASQGTCSDASHIGHAVVASGPGPYPLILPQPGQPELPIYITGPYKGAPFGLSIVTHVLAGPFNLGTIVTRAKIEVDPTTAQITVTTDPLPQVVGGVPTDLRLVNSVIDRPGFMFNPTNCSPQEFSGTAWGTPPPGAGGPGATASISSHFQMGSCQSLKFAPDFKVSTSGKASRANGASLEARIVYPTGPLGANQASSQANIASVKVELPKNLPSRLTTLQKACTAAQFESNPAGCPVESVVGHVKVITPLLPVPLTGPAIFVSHGGEAFPSLIMVLQGYGVTVDLVGSTFISTAGITSSTFKATPDVPFSSFDLTLPQGKFSALAANGNLCKSRLVMPTAFVAQNGAVIHQNTKIAVTGCSRAVRHGHRRLHKGKGRRSRKKKR